MDARCARDIENRARQVARARETKTNVRDAPLFYRSHTLDASRAAPRRISGTS